MNARLWGKKEDDEKLWGSAEARHCHAVGGARAATLFSTKRNWDPSARCLRELPGLTQ